MTVRMKLLFAVLAAVLLSASAFAQNPEPEAAQVPVPGPHGPGGFGPGGFGERMELLGFGDMHGGKVVSGAPFAAVAVAEMKRTLADGTNITHKVQTNVFRDAQGRVRKEVTPPAIGPLQASGAPKTFVVIHDPVAGTNYLLNPENKVAHKLPQRQKNAGTSGPKNGFSSKADVKTDDLGTQTINGITVQGTRYTHTIPAGQFGNDKPVTIVKEEWYSADLQVVVQSKRSDPFMGEATYTLTNIQRSAPDASLFSVPADYTVKEGPLFGGRRGHLQEGGAPPPPTDGAGPGPGLEL